MLLLHFGMLEDLEQWLSQPDNEEALAQMGPPDEAYRVAEKQNAEDDEIRDLERIYGMS